MGAPVISASPSAFGVPTANLGVADQLSAHEISRSPEARCGGPVLVEARERSLIASPTFLSVLAVSPPSFPLRLLPQSSARFALRKVQFLSERKKSGSSRDSTLAATSISGSGILYDLRSRRAHGYSQGSGESSPCRERQPRHRKSENPDNSGS